MTTQSKEYLAAKQRERRALAKEIYTYHLHEKMPGESDKDFRRRFTKRIIVVTDDQIEIKDPFGKTIKIIANTKQNNTI